MSREPRVREHYAAPVTREPRDAIERQTYSRLVEEAASVARLREATGLAVVDMVCIMPFDGGPDRPGIWVVVATEGERHAAWIDRARIVDSVKSLLIAGGYPSAAAQTALVSLAAQETIDKYASKGWDFFR
jgi:hypothetical protein